MVIVKAVAVTGGIGAICGLLLALAAKLFHIDVDQRITDVRNALPGANCGACGYAGCDAMAEAIAAGRAPVDGCPVANYQAHAKIADIMGTSAEEGEKKVAHVLCRGNDCLASKKHEYHGVRDCKAAAAVQGGDKSCDKG